MKREFDAYLGLRAAAENRRPRVAPRIERPSFLQRLLGVLGGIADRIAPLLALVFLLFSIGLLGNAADMQHRIWACMALALACVAMWAFWGDVDA